MAHNLNYNKQRQQYSFFSANTKGWHDLGQLVIGRATSEDAIRHANLDYEVKQAPLFVGFDGELSKQEALETANVLKLSGSKYYEAAQVPNNFVTYRDDTKDVFGIVGSKYTIVQNRDAFKFFDDVVGDKLAIFDTAGALGNGERIFITAKLPSNIRFIHKDDVIEQYLLLTTSHDGSGTVQIMFTPIRVVCNNTLNMAISRTKNKINLRHTMSVSNKLLNGRDILGLYQLYSNEMIEIVQDLVKHPITDEGVDNLVNNLILSSSELQLLTSANNDMRAVDEISTRKKNTIVDIKDAIYLGAGQNFYEGTKLWAYNGITSYMNNYKSYSTPEDRFDYLYTKENLGTKTLELLSVN